MTWCTNERLNLIAALVEIDRGAGTHKVDLLASPNHLKRAQDVIDLFARRIADLRITSPRPRPPNSWRAPWRAPSTDLIVGIARKGKRCLPVRHQLTISCGAESIGGAG